MNDLDAADVIVDLLRRGHAVRFRARGDSMHPVIRCDEVLHVEPAGTLRAGSVVLTLAERGLTAHRVVTVSGDSIVTRGDNAPADDPRFSVASVLGYVTHVERGGRMVQIGPMTTAQRVMRFLRRVRASLQALSGARG